MECHDFDWAFRQVSDGHKVSRARWNTCGIYLQKVEEYQLGSNRQNIFMHTLQGRRIEYDLTDHDQIAEDWYIAD